MTSNVGAKNISSDNAKIGFVTDKNNEAKYEEMKKGVNAELKKVFRPEFLNRLDEIIVFHELTKDEIKKIVSMVFDELNVRLSEKNIEVLFTDAVIDFIAEKGYDPANGARPVRRAIQKYIEDPLSEELLSGLWGEGSKIIIDMDEKKDDAVKFSDKNEKKKTGKRVVKKETA